ncbi:MAG TPA: outer membrane beta-barrel protein [Gemmatimonadales bacterium]
MRTFLKAIVLAAATAVTGSATLGAQDRAVTIYGFGGGISALTDLDASDAQDFKTGFNAGGGIGVGLHRYVALRGEFTFARDELRSGGADTGNNFNKFFYGGDLVLRYPLANGLSPYVFGGGGAVTVDDDADVAAASTTTRGAGRFGLGVSYEVPGSPIGIFAQGTGWVYAIDTTEDAKFASFTETQFDAVYSIGLSYRIRL